MCKTVLDGRVRLLPAAETIHPVRHMGEIVIADESRRDSSAAGKRDDLLSPLNQRVLFVSALLFDVLPARASFAADVDECSGFSHDPREAIAVIAETCGITHQEFWILEQRLERIRILASVLPGKDPA